MENKENQTELVKKLSRERYQRGCISQFQRLGYLDDYLQELHTYKQSIDTRLARIKEGKS